MYLQWLWTFKRVIDEGSYTKAAASQFMTQSAASQQIRQLERYLNAEVIRREGKDLHLTEAGRIVYDFAERVQSQYLEARRQIEEISGRAFSVVTVVSSSGPLVHCLPTAMRDFWLEHPEIAVKTLSRAGKLISEAVRDGLADFGIEPSLLVDTTLERIPLRNERVVVVVSPRDPLARMHVDARTLSGRKIAILGKTSEFRRLVDAWFESRGTRMRDVLEVASVEEIRSAALENVAVGVLDRYVVADDIASCQLIPVGVEGFDIEQTMYVIHRKELREPARWLMETLLATSEADVANSRLSRAASA